MNFNKDSIYANPVDTVDRFKFDEAVAAVFPDMIRRSVPGYNAIISAIGLLAGKFAQADSRCYDLGCSLGAAALAMRQYITVPDCRIVAVDSSEAMLAGLKKILADRPEADAVPIQLVCSDIREVAVEQASVVVLNFTLQFLPVADRVGFLEKIYRGLLPGGILILSEKLKFDDDRQQQLQTEMHHAFKKAQGYSDLEISQKRTALENVLIPETFNCHRQRLLQAGFSSAEVWFQYFNFASIIALK